VRRSSRCSALYHNQCIG